MAKRNKISPLLGAGLILAANSATPASADSFSPPQTISIPAGVYISGSSRAEKDYAYRLDEKAYGHSATRQGQWYENESAPQKISLPAFEIMKTPVTNGQYAKFIKETGYRGPNVKRAVWTSYALIHPFEATKTYQWKNTLPPQGKRNHPVVLVSHKDAREYARWLSKKTEGEWRLPSEQEWEKAARGVDGRYFPWGKKFNPSKLNSHDKGPFSTTKVGQFTGGASPFGMLEAAGQVYEWTSTKGGSGQYIVKGGSWDDKGCGVCRPAAKHGRPATMKHILIGFRLVKNSQ